MGLQDHISKYRTYPTYTQIATEAYNAGLKEGREEQKTDKVRKMEKEIISLDKMALIRYELERL